MTNRIHSQADYLIDATNVNNPVIQTADFVAANSLFVRINKRAISDFCQKFDTNNLQPWLNFAPVDLLMLDSSPRLHFVLLMSSLSFRFWGNPKWTIEYNGREYDGAWGLVAALWKAFEAGILALDPKSWSDFEEQRAKTILTGNILIPRFADRLMIIRQLGCVLGNDYKNSFECFLEHSDGDAMQLVLTLASEFPSFRDVSTLDDRTVFFYKRAQLLVADIARMCSGTNSTDIQGLSQLSACADYKLPWLLRKLDILAYTNSLSEQIDKGIEILPNSREEIEIRANTVWAVELIKRNLRTRAPEIMTMQINDYLWLQSQDKSSDDSPYHLTDTTFY